MLSKKFPAGQSPGEYIEIQWEKGFTHVKVLFAGKPIGGFENKDELFKGKSFLIYGDETVFIGFSVKKAGFILKRNGVYLDHSPYHPKNNMSPLTWIGVVLGLVYCLCAVANWLSFDRYLDLLMAVYLVYTFLLGVLFMTSPYLLRQGYVYWYYVVLAAIFIYVSAHIWSIAQFGLTSNWGEDIFVLFFINAPALIMMTLFFGYRKLCFELGNDRVRKANFQKLVA